MAVNQGPFQEVIRGWVETIPGEVGDSSTNSLRISMPVSETEELACLVHRVELVNSLPDWTGVTDYNSSCWAMIPTIAGHFDMTLGRPGVYAYWLWGVNTVIQVGHFEGHQVWNFDPPILVAQRYTYLYVNHGPGAGQITTHWAAINIGYTVEKVSKDAFIAALVSHIQ